MKSGTTFCPNIYRMTDPDKIPNRSAFDKVQKWRRNKQRKGLLLVGPTRTGKTRAMWNMLEARRNDPECKLNTLYFDAMAWPLAVSSIMAQPEETEEWARELCNYDLCPSIFWDDLFKFPQTEARMSMLFGVIERRMAHMCYNFCTLNGTPDEIRARMPEKAASDMVLPLIERLKECCEVIEF